MKHKLGVTMTAVSYSLTLLGNVEFDLNRIVENIQTFMYQSVVLGQLLRLSRIARLSWGLAKYRVDTKA